MKEICIVLGCILLSVTIGKSQQVEREYVAVELGIGTWCLYCPGAVTGVNDMIGNGDDIAVVVNHIGDAYENTYSGSRDEYYAYIGYPDARFDGIIDYIGGISCPNPGGLFAAYHNHYLTRKAILSSFTMDLSVTAGSPGYDAVITIDQVDNAVTANCAVHLFVTESNISESWQGCMTEFDFVNRLMVPNEDGTPLNISGTQQIINLNFSLDAGWDTGNCELVAFIQNNTSKEVYQCTKATLPAGPPADLVLGDDIIGPGEDICWFATNSVTVPGIPGSFLIENGANVDIIAGSVITLNPGFYAEHGSYLHAFISSAGCTSPPPLPAVVQESGNIIFPALQLRPNPANDMVYVGFNDPAISGEAMVYIYDIVGEQMLEMKIFLSAQYGLNITNLPPGLFLVNVVLNDNVFSGKLIKH